MNRRRALLAAGLGWPLIPTLLPLAAALPARADGQPQLLARLAVG